MLNNTIHLITIALTERRLLLCSYLGHKRIFAPHHLGLLNEKLQLHAYQLKGTSRTGRLGWKNLEVQKMEKVELLSENFEPRKDHNPENSHYSRIDVSLS